MGQVSQRWDRTGETRELTFAVGTQENETHSRFSESHDLLSQGIQVYLLVIGHRGDKGSVDPILELAGRGAVGCSVGLGRHLDS
jgi:hypothetical protein